MSDDQRAEVAALFDRVAGTYDRVGVELFQPVAAALVRELRPAPGERALDIGCGRGAALLRLARAVGPTGRATGIDLAPSMVAAAAAEAEAAGLAGVVDVHLGDAQEPDPPGGPFDVVASSLVIFFLPHPAAALRRWRDLVETGGRLGITTFGPYSDSWRAVDEVFKPYLPSQMPDPRTLPATSPFSSDAGVEGLLADAGFADVRTVTEPVQVRFADVAQWEAWTWSTGQRRMWEAVPAPERPAVRERAAAVLDALRASDGRFGFDQVVRVTVGRR